MIICISGYTGSGKTTVGELLAKELGIRHIAHSYKDFASGKENVINVIKKADSRFAKNFDSQVVKEAKKQDCVVTTWLGPWLIKEATLRIWLNASLESRAKRIARDKGMSVAKAKKYVMEKDKLTAAHFKRIYKIDLADHSQFDAEINTEKYKPKELASIIAYLSIEKSKRRFD